MTQKMDKSTLEKLVEASDVKTLDFARIEELVANQAGIADFVPDGVCQVDPRNGERILFNTARARRPHDNRPKETTAAAPAKCVICEGKTTGVIDYRELSEGFTFINKNLFPMLFPTSPRELPSDEVTAVPCSSRGQKSYGLHLLQWTSSVHDKDWENMPLEDLVIVMERLAALEERLVSGKSTHATSNEPWGDRAGNRGFVSIIKNYGRLVGGSLAHGHQQIAFSNVMPRKFLDDLRFEQSQGENFAGYLLRENPEQLVVRDYGAASLVVPYFMKRPFEMFLVLKDTKKRYLHELNKAELEAVAKGWSEAIGLILELMPRVGRESAYNVMTHVGPGAGIYFEFLPYTQETGGYEHLGLFICQGNPADSAQQLRALLAERKVASSAVAVGA